jgi:hypothetical protein
MSRWYVAMIKGTSKMIAFSSHEFPTKNTHKHLGFFMGPFKSKKGAEYAAKIGPKASIQGVNDYERLAELELFK